MHEGGHNSNNTFPHDGEHGINCTGYGCDCDEQNYGSRHSGGSIWSSKGIWIAYIAALVVGYGVNELLGVIIMIGVIFAIIFK